MTTPRDERERRAPNGKAAGRVVAPSSIRIHGGGGGSAPAPDRVSNLPGAAAAPPTSLAAGRDSNLLLLLRGGARLSPSPRYIQFDPVCWDGDPPASLSSLACLLSSLFLVTVTAAPSRLSSSPHRAYTTEP